MESGANGFPHFLTDVQPAKPGLGEEVFFASFSFQCECFTRFSSSMRCEKFPFSINEFFKVDYYV